MSNQITPNPSVPTQVVAEVKFPRWINNLGIIPTSYKDSMSYYECLAWLCKFLEETVIPSVNENGEAVEELQNLYIELNSYVTHYFETLDVQEEINNKLDDMVEQGTLQEIIADYLNSKAVFGYDTVADMKNSTNLINGSYARTLGYYSKNDGGSALYKIRTITNDDVIDEGSIIQMNDEENQLIAEQIFLNNNVNILTFGAKPDGLTDNSSIINKVINFVNDNSFNIFIPKGDYVVSEDLSKLKAGINLIGEISGNGVTEKRAKLIDKRDSGNYLIEYKSGTLGGNIENISFYNDSENSLNCINLNLGGYSSLLKNLIFQLYDICINVNGIITARIDNCNFWNCGSGTANSENSAVVITSGSDIIISNCSSDHTRFIINCKSTCYGVLKLINNFFEISNNKIVKGNAPIYLDGQNSVIATGNTFVNVNVEFWKNTFEDSNYANVPYMIYSSYNTYLTLNNNTFQTGTGSGGYETEFNNYQGRFLTLSHGTVCENIFNDCAYITQAIVFGTSDIVFSNNYIMTRTYNYESATYLDSNKYVIYNETCPESNNNTYRIIQQTSALTYVPRLFYRYSKHNTLNTGGTRDFNEFTTTTENCITYQIHSPAGLPYGLYHLRVLKQFSADLRIDTYFIVSTSSIVVTSSASAVTGSGYKVKISYYQNELYVQIFGSTLQNIVCEIDGFENLMVDKFRNKSITTEITDGYSATIQS